MVRGRDPIAGEPMGRAALRGIATTSCPAGMIPRGDKAEWSWGSENDVERQEERQGHHFWVQGKRGAPALGMITWGRQKFYKLGLGAGCDPRGKLHGRGIHRG